MSVRWQIRWQLEGQVIADHLAPTSRDEHSFWQKGLNSSHRIAIAIQLLSTEHPICLVVSHPYPSIAGIHHRNLPAQLRQKVLSAYRDNDAGTRCSTSRMYIDPHSFVVHNIHGSFVKYMGFIAREFQCKRSTYVYHSLSQASSQP